VPLKVGARLVTLRTVIEKGASFVTTLPSETLIEMSENVPTFADVGVPQIEPLRLENDTQAGLPTIEYVNGSPFASDALGRK
jgi:hypothetical protein